MGLPTSTIIGPQRNAYVDKYDHFFQVFSFSYSTYFPLFGNVEICLQAA